MIVTEKVDVNIKYCGTHIKEYYKTKGYDINEDSFSVNIEDVFPQSHILVEVQ